MPPVATTELKGALAELTSQAGRAVDKFAAGLGRLSKSEAYGFAADGYPKLLDPFASAAGKLTAQWYGEQPSKPAPRGSAVFVPEPADLPPVEQLSRSARWAVSLDDPATALRGNATRVVMNQSRKTVVDNAIREGVLWVRVAQPDACAWCRMLAGRSAVYASEASALTVVGEEIRRGTNRGRGGRIVGHTGKTRRDWERPPPGVKDRRRKVGEEYHDHCSCEAVPLRDGVPWYPPDKQIVVDQYRAALDEHGPDEAKILKSLTVQDFANAAVIVAGTAAAVSAVPAVVRAARVWGAVRGAAVDAGKVAAKSAAKSAGGLGDLAVAGPPGSAAAGGTGSSVAEDAAGGVSYLSPDELAGYFNNEIDWAAWDWETLPKLKEDIASSGIRNPVTIETDGKRATLMDGHHRVKVAQDLGLEQVPVRITRSDLSHPSEAPVGPGLIELLEASADKQNPPLMVPIDQLDRHMIDSGAENSSKLDELIEEFKANGAVSPVTVRTDGRNGIVDGGNDIIEAARQAGLTHVPVKFVRDDEVSESGGTRLPNEVLEHFWHAPDSIDPAGGTADGKDSAGGMEDLPRKSESSGVGVLDQASKDANSVNPNWRDSDYDANCVRCVTAYELRRRGYDVEAGPSYGVPMNPQAFVEMWSQDGKPAEWLEVSNILGTRESSDGYLLSNYPDGARGIILTEHSEDSGGGAHVFSWERVGDAVHYFDAQDSEPVDTDRLFAMAKLDADSYVFRTDTLDPGPDALGLVVPVPPPPSIAWLEARLPNGINGDGLPLTDERVVSWWNSGGRSSPTGRDWVKERGAGK